MKDEQRWNDRKAKFEGEFSLEEADYVGLLSVFRKDRTDKDCRNLAVEIIEGYERTTRKKDTLRQAGWFFYSFFPLGLVIVTLALIFSSLASYFFWGVFLMLPGLFCLAVIVILWPENSCPSKTAYTKIKNILNSTKN